MPRKVPDVASAKMKEKPAKKKTGKEKVEKQKTKTPTVITIRLPFAKGAKVNVRPSSEVVGENTEEGSKEPSPELTPAARRKIELANEVAQTQLGKAKLDPLALALIDKVTDVVKKKRGRPKKNHSPSIDADEPKPKVKKTAKKTLNKSPATKKKPEMLPKAVNKRKADSTSNQTPKRKYVRKKPFPVKKPIVKRKGKNAGSNTAETPINEVPTSDKPDLSEPNKDTDKDLTEIDSRPTSVNDCPSWVKDISSSSTTTCNTITNDILTKDARVILENIDEVKKRREIQGDDDSTSSDSSSDCSSSSYSMSNSASNSLNLSRSSITSTTRQSSMEIEKNKETNREQTLAKLAQTLQEVDLNSISLFGFEDQNVDNSYDIFQDKIFKLLKHENEVVKCCGEIESFLKPGGNRENEELSNQRSSDKELNDLIQYTDRSEDDENYTSSKSKHVMLDQNCIDEEDPFQSTKEEFTPNKMKYMSFEDNDDDDDDALSLFAESLTGLESSKYSNSADSVSANASDYDEYIPQPTIPREIDEPPSYIPTKILPDATQNSKVYDNQAESLRGQQNSSPIHNRGSQTVPYQDTPNPNRLRPLLLNDIIQKPLTGVQSIVFRGICFYNLISTCKKRLCKFPHQQLHNTEVVNRLAKLTEEKFVTEYMLLRSWPNMRRMYGLAYIHECVTRKLTRVLVEMAIDFILKANKDFEEDIKLKIYALEKTLLYLNNIDSHTYEDLLLYNFGNNVLLCDHFMHTIAVSQNFSRFMAIFRKLTEFIVAYNRRFDFEVANHILERISILPYDEALAQGMLNIIRNTDPDVFDNKSMAQFENQLKFNNLYLYNNLCTLREIAGKKAIVKSPREQNNMESGEEMFIMPTTESPQLENLTNPVDDITPKPFIQKVIRPTISNRDFKMNDSTNMNITPSRIFNRPVQKRPWPRPPMAPNLMGPNLGRAMNIRAPRFPRNMQMVMRPLVMDRWVDQRVAYGPNGDYRKFPPRRPGPDFY